MTMGHGEYIAAAIWRDNPQLVENAIAFLGRSLDQAAQQMEHRRGKYPGAEEQWRALVDMSSECWHARNKVRAILRRSDHETGA